MKRSLSLFALTALGACAATPTGPPDAVSLELIAAIDEARYAEADDLFERVADNEAFTEEIYPILFETARERHGVEDYEGAANLLRFIARHYGAGNAAEEALLHTLFLQRSQLTGPTPELSAEIDQVVAALRTRESASAWVELVATQAAIDQDRLPQAQESFDRFVENWDGQAADDEFMLYVENIARYLDSH